MIKDKKLKMEMPENEYERMWYQMKVKLEEELADLEEQIKPKNRKKELDKLRHWIKINKELIATCKKNLKL